MIGVGQNRRLLRSGGSAFASFRCTCLDQHLLRSDGSAFGTLVDRCLVRFVIGVWIVLSLARSHFCSLSSFFLWLSLSFARVRKMFEGKMIL